jgi:replicative DNA helicase
MVSPEGTLLEAARQYGELGYPVFPCAPGTKAPLTKHGNRDATTVRSQIDEWWAQRPNANIGLATQGLIVIDVDSGSTWLSEDKDRADELAAAPLSLTANGGQQYVFRQPAETHWRNTAGRLADRVDTRGDGGYIVVPPSILQGGRRYRWDEGRELDQPYDQLPEPPHWLCRELDALATETRLNSRNETPRSPSTSPTVARVATGSTVANAIPSGQRNATLARLAGTMRRVGMSRSEILAALERANSERCSPPLNPPEVDRVADSVARYEPDQISVALVENHWEQMRESDSGPRFTGVTSAELDANEYSLEYLIPGLLVRGQPGVIAGPKKTLKTNISVDLAISLGQCEPFLGAHPVATASRVGLMSGESGAATIQETARRIATSKGLRLAECDNVIWSFEVPQLGQAEQIRALKAFIEAHRLDVLILDPTYLMMLGLGENAGNLFIVGSYLKSLGELAQETGCTPLLCHHLKKGIADPYEPAELDNIAWAGFQEFVRQWLLLNRRVRYDPDLGGHHELWMSAGGSAGHSGLWGIDVDEGTRQDSDGRRWDVQIMTAAEAYAARDEASETVTRQRRERRDAARVDQDQQTIVDVLPRFPDGETARAIREATGLSTRRFNPAINELVSNRVVSECEITKSNGQKYSGYRLEDVTGTTGTDRDTNTVQ